jgi:hypothetical protein
MKEGQKVYIRGVENRGNEVIETLKKLGGINRYFLGGGNKNAYYYINPKGAIDYVYAYKLSPEYLLVKEFYREIKLPKEKKWTDGDLLVRSHEGIKEYIVYSDEKSEIDGYIVLSYVYADDNVCYANVTIVNTSDFKPASKDDTEEFQKLLHKYGKEWDFKSKKLIHWRWKPEHNEDYWYINDIGEVCRTNYNKFMPNNDYRIEIGNCFQTKDDAFTAKDKMAKVLLNK